ncbi:hypothetical protein IGB42_01550 [Andreprevotia sp. IGB-42]|uniref:DUF1045 domain-containing protein n=1 Tax=Andreprevotia sp. IGB-42 TaxID=2497473 RepID=UPI001356E895|nr:DUF1045 domain-containing protein [Andreprevotia sp. IGB-42]KAF0813871.1 hypothetical protein IGB42_01550 [Andreprevotia sp. IGB-42]
MAYRYAIYLVPPAEHPLWHAGTHWLGSDPATAAALRPPQLPGLDAASQHAITSEPRRYGLHATLKAPFRLRDDCNAADLIAALQAFTRALQPFTLPALQVTELDGFLCLRPAAESQALQALADACVVELDAFRAPLSDTELARRKPDLLDARGKALLARWAYPHVFERFRCHITLSGRLPPSARNDLLPALVALFAPALAEPLPAQLALFAEDHAGAAFRLVQRFSLGGNA